MSDQITADITNAELRKDWQGNECARADVLVQLRMSTDAYRRLDPTLPVHLTQEQP